MKLEPTLDRVAIKREEKCVTEGGIILPDKAKKTNYGEVIATGPGAWNMDGTRREMGVEKGDIVFFSDEYSATTVKDIVIVDEADVLAIVREK